MCGIAGFNFRVDDKNILNSLYRRGPDEKSKWNDDVISLFYTRLSKPVIINPYVKVFKVIR